MNKQKSLKIMLVGGGSGGSVSPLLAVAAEISKQHPQADFLFIGGMNGPEKTMVEQAGLRFYSIAAGKFRRYFSWKNFIAPFSVVRGFFQARKILQGFMPQVVFGTGSFIQVPVMWAAWTLNIPTIFHQQDVQPSLANSLCGPIAKKITVTFPQSARDFSTSWGLLKPGMPDKIIVTGNPFRESLRAGDAEQGRKYFGLHTQLPVLLVTGGGTGASGLNSIVWKSLPALTRIVQVIHQTGEGKNNASQTYENYHAFEFISDMGQAYAAADIVLCRAGVSTITELSNLKKIAILVPMPGSHQEYNAAVLEHAAAAFVIAQKELHEGVLPQLIRQLLFRFKMQQGMKEIMANIMPHNATQRISQIILEIIS